MIGTSNQNVAPQKYLVKLDDDVIASSNTLTWDEGGNMTDGKVVVIGAITYRFKDTLAQAYDVKIGADGDATLLNLEKAINASGVAGTNYFAGTLIHPDYTATYTAASNELGIENKVVGFAGNGDATTTDEATLSWGSATTLGGGGRTGTVTITKGGFMNAVFAKVLGLTIAASLALSIEDADGIVFVSGATINEGSTDGLTPDCQIMTGDILKLYANEPDDETIEFPVIIR